MSPRRRTRRRIALGATVAATVCGIIAVTALVRSSGSTPPAAPVASAAQARSGRDNVMLLWHHFAQCLRTHGYPQIADPTYLANGDVSFGAQGLQAKQAVRTVGRTACRAQFAAVQSPAANPPPSAADLHKMVLFSRCMRQHGIPDWPDPRADGTYPLDQRLVQMGKRGIVTQLVACRNLDPGRGIAVSSSSLPKTKT
jgi:hypothetical protein